MLGLYVRREGDGYGWELVRTGGASADVVARSARTMADEPACWGAIQELAREREAHRWRVDPIRKPGGGWRWLLVDLNGVPVARSPATYRDAATCRAALGDLRLELLASAIGEVPSDPGGSPALQLGVRAVAGMASARPTVHQQPRLIPQGSDISHRSQDPGVNVDPRVAPSK